MPHSNREHEGNGALKICRTFPAVFEDPEAAWEVGRDSRGIVHIHFVT